MERDAEDQLLALAKCGDRDALTMLLERHGPAVRQQLDINSRWRSVIDDDDIMQVTYFEAFQQIGHFRSDAGAFAGWLGTIARNNLRDAIAWLECQKRAAPGDRLEPPRGQDSVAWLYELAGGTATTPSAHASSKETRRILEREIAELPAVHGQVLQLVYFDGKAVAEVAELLGRTRGAVHLLRLRALDGLRDRFGSRSDLCRVKT